MQTQTLFGHVAQILLYLYFLLCGVTGFESLQGACCCLDDWNVLTLVPFVKSVVLIFTFLSVLFRVEVSPTNMIPLLQ